MGRKILVRRWELGRERGCGRVGLFFDSGGRVFWDKGVIFGVFFFGEVVLVFLGKIYKRGFLVYFGFILKSEWEIIVIRVNIYIVFVWFL